MLAGWRKVQGFLENQNFLVKRTVKRSAVGGVDAGEVVTGCEVAVAAAVVLTVVVVIKWMNDHACVKNEEQGVEQELNLFLLQFGPDQDQDGCDCLAELKIVLDWNWLVLQKENTDLPLTCS